MANRSYLYSINQDKKNKLTKAFDISEQNYEIPIIYKLLVSFNTKIVKSHLFEDRLALIGDAEEGSVRLKLFFTKLLDANVFKTTKLKDLQNDFLKHLDRYTLNYFLFEPIEVIEMDDVDPNQKIQSIYNEIQDHQGMLDEFIQNVCGECWSELGIDTANYLYYSLADEKEVIAIEKEFSNKKRSKLEELIQNKPTIKRYCDLIAELDNEKDANLINQIIDKAFVLKPTFEEQKALAYLYQDLDKKLQAYLKLLNDFPNEGEDLYYWISDIYEEKGDYKNALEFAIKEIVIKEPTECISNLENLIEYGKFDKEKIYEEILSKVLNQNIIKGLIIDVFIEKSAFEKAEESIYKYQHLFEAEELRFYFASFGRAFLQKNKIAKGLQFIEDGKAYQTASSFFQENKNPSEALHWYVKLLEICPIMHDGFALSYGITSFIYDYSDGEFSEENIDLQKLFTNWLPEIHNYKPKILVQLAKELRKFKEINFQNISKEVLLKTIPRIDKEKLLVKAKKQLKKIANKNSKN